MLIPQRGEAVVSRYKEILAGDVSLAVKRRLMVDDRSRQSVPDLLRFVRNFTPGCEGATVNIELGLLSCRPGEGTLRLVLVITLTATMEEGQVSHGTPAIGYKDGWRKARHS